MNFWKEITKINKPLNAHFCVVVECNDNPAATGHCFVYYDKAAHVQGSIVSTMVDFNYRTYDSKCKVLCVHAATSITAHIDVPRGKNVWDCIPPFSETKYIGTNKKCDMFECKDANGSRYNVINLGKEEKEDHIVVSFHITKL